MSVSHPRGASEKEWEWWRRFAATLDQTRSEAPNQGALSGALVADVSAAIAAVLEVAEEREQQLREVADLLVGADRGLMHAVQQIWGSR